MRCSPLRWCIKQYIPMAKSKYTITIDRILCIGAGSCVAIAPTAFALDSEAKAILLPSATGVSNEELLEAAQVCPVAAIIIKDENGKQIFP